MTPPDAGPQGQDPGTGRPADAVAPTGDADGGEPVDREVFQLSEASVAPVRLGIVAFNAVLFVFFLRGPDPIPWLAYSVLGLAAGYAVWIYGIRPYRASGVVESAAFTSVMDGTLILAWLTATGGFASPYFPLFYVSIFAVALRYDPWETAGAATVYTFAYAGLTALAGNFWADLPMLVLRSGYIYATGALGTLISLATLQEATDKVRYQRLADELEATAEKLGETVSLHEATLDATEEGLLVVDTDERIVSYNDRFQEILGIPDAVLEAEDDGVVRRYVVDQLENPDAFQASTEAAYQDEEAILTDEIELEDGRILERHSRPQRMDGEVVGRVWSFRDVTEKRRAQRETEQTNELLERFAGTVSEDLREPLRALRRRVEKLGGHVALEDGPEAEQLAARARADVERLDRLLEGLLSYSQAGEDAGEMEAFPLEEALEDALRNLEARIEEDRIEVYYDGLPHVYGDRAQVALVLQKALVSAAEAQSEPPRVVRVYAQREADRWAVAVDSEGARLPDEPGDEPRGLFGASGDDAPGRGLDRAVCQRILEAHRGEMRLEAVPGMGATLWFTLPAADGQATPARGEAARGRS